jgi:hypothetical protein
MADAFKHAPFGMEIIFSVGFCIDHSLLPVFFQLPAYGPDGADPSALFREACVFRAFSAAVAFSLTLFLLTGNILRTAR